MKNEMERKKTLAYHVPYNAREIGWSAIVVWRDPKDENHRHVTLPWEVAIDISPKERQTLARLGKAICKSIASFMKSERKKLRAKTKKTVKPAKKGTA